MSAMSKKRYDWLREVYGEFADTIKLAEEEDWWYLDAGPDAPQIPEEANDEIATDHAAQNKSETES